MYDNGRMEYMYLTSSSELKYLFPHVNFFLSSSKLVNVSKEVYLSEAYHLIKITTTGVSLLQIVHLDGTCH